MNCSKCAAQVEGFVPICRACGHVSESGFPPRLIGGLVAAAILAVMALAIRSETATASGSSWNIHSNRLERLPAPERSKAFSALIVDAGEQCASVTRYYFRGDIGPNALWNIKCSDSGDWMISIAANSWTRVTGCAKLDDAGTPCWTKL